MSRDINSQILKYLGVYRNSLESICFEIGKRHYFKFDAIGTSDNHINFSCSNPKYSTKKLMQIGEILDNQII